MNQATVQSTAAGESSLGRLVSEHGYRGSRAQIAWAVLGVVPALFLVPAIVFAVPLLLFPGLLGLAILAWAFLRNPRVRVFEQGLEIHSGWKVETCRWEDLDAFWQQVTVNQATLAGIAVVRGPALHEFRIRRRDGKKFRFDANYRQVAALGVAIRARSFPALLERAHDDLRQNGTTKFDGIVIGRDGFRSKLAGRCIPWDEMRGFDVRLDEGFLRIDKGAQKVWGGWRVEKLAFSGSVGDIPNISVLVALLAERMPVPQGLQRAFLDPARADGGN